MTDVPDAPATESIAPSRAEKIAPIAVTAGAIVLASALFAMGAPPIEPKTKPPALHFTGGCEVCHTVQKLAIEKLPASTVPTSEATTPNAEQTGRDPAAAGSDDTDSGSGAGTVSSAVKKTTPAQEVEREESASDEREVVAPEIRDTDDDSDETDTEDDPDDVTSESEDPAETPEPESDD